MYMYIQAIYTCGSVARLTVALSARLTDIQLFLELQLERARNSFFRLVDKKFFTFFKNS